MDDVEVIETLAARAHPPEPFVAPRVSLWRRAEPTMLGISGIVELLVAWELLPHLVTMKAGTKMFFAPPSQVAGTLWTMFVSGTVCAFWFV